MGCLNVTAIRIGDGLQLAANRVGSGISVQATRIGGMSVTCGLVCSVNKARYLRVEPKSIFLMPGNNFTDDVLIMANVDWQVK